MQQALLASDCQVVTVAVRPGTADGQTGPEPPGVSRSRQVHDPPEYGRMLQSPTMRFGCRCSAAICWRSRETRVPAWVKLEVLGDKKTLLPDPVGTLEATKELVKEGFTVLCYTAMIRLPPDG